MSHVFISYSTKNAEYAYKLADKLRDEGFNVWIDNAELRSSDNWWESIVKALRVADAFIVIMSPESRASRWVQREVTLADNWQKPAFPLLLDGEAFEIYVLTQFKNVKDGSLPPASFYDDLARFVLRETKQGIDVTERKIALDDSDVREALENAPKPESKSASGLTFDNFFEILFAVVYHAFGSPALIVFADLYKDKRLRPRLFLGLLVLFVSALVLVFILNTMNPERQLDRETATLTATYTLTATNTSFTTPRPTLTNSPLRPTATLGRPDLLIPTLVSTIDNIIIPSGASQVVVEFGITIKNQGSGASGLFSVTLYEGTTTYPVAVVGNLLAGEIITLTQDVVFSVAGEHDIRVIVDSDNQVIESLEDNNGSDITVTVSNE